MAKDFKNAILRNPQSLFGDVLGMASLVVLLYGALTLPGLF